MSGDRGLGRTAWILGLLGLLPFLAASGVYAFGPERWSGPALLALLAYSAAILSFLGGIRWGAEMNARPGARLSLVLSNAPPLVAFALLAAPAIDARWQIGGFLLAFVAQGLWDLTLRGPNWWPLLRLVLTAGVALCLAVALAAAFGVLG